VDRAGGAPGRYAVSSVVFALAWFPLRLYLDRGDPLAAIIITSGLYGVVWAFAPPLLDVLNRHFGPQRPTGSIAEADRPAWIRRGALLGLTVGVPFHSALLVLCLTSAASRLSAGVFGVVVVAIAVISVRRLRTPAATA
jgi:hypothetical protein